MARTRNARGGRRPRRKTSTRRGGRKTGTRKVAGGKRRGATRRARGVRRGGQKKAAPLSHHPVEQHTSGKTKGAMKQGHTTGPKQEKLGPNLAPYIREQTTGASKYVPLKIKVGGPEQKMLPDNYISLIPAQSTSGSKSAITAQAAKTPSASLKTRVANWNDFVDEIRNLGGASMLTADKDRFLRIYGLQPTKKGKLALYNGPLYTRHSGMGHKQQSAPEPLTRLLDSTLF